MLQRIKERNRKADIKKLMKKRKLKKFGYIILIAGVISTYFAITSFYLYLIHDYEIHYSNDYKLFGSRI
jgi:hypothetical protein